jgi:hypothetical protein
MGMNSEKNALIFFSRQQLADRNRTESREGPPAAEEQEQLAFHRLSGGSMMEVGTPTRGLISLEAFPPRILIEGWTEMSWFQTPGRFGSLLGTTQGPAPPGNGGIKRNSPIS